MKKIVLAIFLFVQAACVMAQEPVKSKMKSVNLYRQPFSGAQVIKTLGTSDEVIIMRRFDTNWTIVQAGSETGYVHNIHLKKLKKLQVTDTATK